MPLALSFMTPADLMTLTWCARDYVHHLNPQMMMLMTVMMTANVCFMLSDDTMLTHWKKSITRRRVKSVVQSDINTVAGSAAGQNDIQTVVCKLCLTPCHVDQMYMLEQCHCSFCLEVIFVILCCQL